MTNEGAGCEETEVSINERKGQSGGVFQAEGRAEAQNSTCDCVLVVGGEKMNGKGGAAATDFVATMLHPEAEYAYGLT